MEQPRVEKVLRLMRLMSGNVYYTIDELANLLETSSRSIYRYIDTFKEVGFVVDKVKTNIYRLIKAPSQMKDLKKLVFFSDEEAKVLCYLIENLDSTNTLKASLYKKLSAIYDISSINEYTGSKSNASNIQAIKNAMNDKVQIVLKNYASANSGEIRDRIVEPFGFTNNHIDIWAYDVENRENRLFKIPRIDWVDITSRSWEHEGEHHRQDIDAFRMSGEDQIHVRLKLSLRAKNLLLEEFPLAEPGITQEGEHWMFDSMVCKMEGVGRFCIGLANEIEILDSPELEKYVRDFISKYFL